MGGRHCIVLGTDPKTDDAVSPMLPEKLLIYHAGTGRITFIAMIKVTSLFLGVFLCFVMVPAYITNDKSELEAAERMYRPGVFRL